MCWALEYRGYRLDWHLPDQLVLFRTFDFAKRYIMGYIFWYDPLERIYSGRYCIIRASFEQVCPLGPGTWLEMGRWRK